MRELRSVIRAVFPQKRAAIEVHVARNADHLALTVDVVGDAVRVSQKRSEVSHYAVLPEERMREGIVGQVRVADYLSRIALLMAMPALPITPPRLPRSVTVPCCHSTA